MSNPNRNLKSLILCYGFLILSANLSRKTFDESGDKSYKPEKSLNIIHLNDIYDIRQSPQCASSMLDYIDNDTLKLFSGDLLNPSTASEFLYGEQMIPFMKLIRFQYSVLGNHELDFGESHFIKLKDKMETTWLLANFKRKIDNKLIGFALESAVTYINGFTIGVFGLVDMNWVKSLEKSTIDNKNYIYEDFKTTAVRVSKYLKEEKKCDLIFAITHMNNESDEILLEDDNNYIDMVFGGHEHIYYIKRIKEKILLKSGSDFAFFSNVKISFGPNKPTKYFCNERCKNYEFLLDEELNNDEKVFEFSLNRANNEFLNIVINKIEVLATGKKNEILDNYVKGFIDEQIKQHLNPILIFTEKLDTRETTTGSRESAALNFYSDFGRAYYGTEIGLVNSMMMKGDKIYPENTVLRKLDFLKLFPYHRDVYQVIFIKGLELIISIEEILSNYPKVSKRFLGVSGITFSFWPEANVGSRIDRSTLKVNGLAIDEERVYSCTILSSLMIEKIGFNVLLEKQVLTPKNQRFEPIDLFTRLGNFFNENEELVVEFIIFKQFCGDFKLDHFENIEYANSGLDDIILEDVLFENKNCIEVIKKLPASTIKRLRIYSIANNVVVKNNHHIFSVSPKVESRIFPLKNEFLV